MSIRVTFALALLSLVVPAVAAQLRAEAAVEGRALFEQGRYEKAAEAFERALSSGEATVRDRALLALSYAHSDQPNAAKLVAEHAVADAPNDRVVRLAYANVLYMEARYEAARQAFERARELDPASVPARDGLVASLVNLAAEELNKGELAAADRHLGEALELNGSNPAALRLFVALREQQGRDEGVTAALERLSARAPQAAGLRAELGKRYLSAGRREDALAAFLEAERLGTDDPFPYLYLARAQLTDAARSRTVNRLHLAIGKGIERAGALRIELARHLEGGEQEWSEADVEAIESIVEKSEEPVAVIEDALKLLRAVREEPAAFEEELRRLASWYPNSTHLKAAIGSFLEEQGEWAEAQEHWEEVVRDHPTFAGAHLGLARSLEELGRLPEARLAYRRALDRAPEEEPLYSALARLYRGEEKRLRSLYLDQLAMESRNTVLLSALIELEQRMGLAEEAAAHAARRAEVLEDRRKRAGDSGGGASAGGGSGSGRGR